METLYEKIYNDLYCKIQTGRYAPGDVLPSEAALCGEYGVSRITAARALNELPAAGLIGPKKKKGSIVLPLPYSHRRSPRTIAVLFSDFAHFGKKIESTLAAYAKKRGYSVACFDSGHSKTREREILKHLLSEKVSGLIIWPITRSSNLDILARFAQEKTPMCFLDYSSYGMRSPCVCSDNFGGMYELTKHLIALGHRHIAYFPFKENFLPTEEERFSAYCRAIIESDAVLDPAYFIRMPPDIKNSTTENASRYDRCAGSAVEHILSLPMRPTAVVCVNDETAWHLIREADKRGLRVPDDLSVTGFDNISVAAESEITTVSQDFGEMAKTALNMLLRQIAEPSLINSFEGTSRIRSVIWDRGSTRRLP